MHRGGRAQVCSRTSAHIRAHSRTSARYALAYTRYLQNMHFIYYITHKILKICKNIA